MRAELADGRILEFPDGTDPSVIQSTVKKVLGHQEAPKEEAYNPLSPENILGSAVEPLMTIGSGLPATIAGGIHGLGTLATGGTGQEAEENIQSTAESLTYQPRTKGGQIATEAITYPFRKLAEGTTALGEQQLKINPDDSPEMQAGKATFVKTMGDVIPMVLGGAAMRGKPKFPKVEAAIKKAAMYPARKIGSILGAGKESVSHRLPGGHERAIGDTLVELIGKERLPAVKRALLKAKAGETVGQAAARTGSTELSALQKYLETRDPSGYADIYKGQQHGRLKTMKKIGGTPEKLAGAESLMRKHAAEGYGKVSKDLVDPRSPREMLIDAATKAKVKGAQAEASKVSALQDKGRMQTIEAQMQSAAKGREPLPKTLREQSIREPARYGDDPSRYHTGRIKGEVKAPAKYMPQTPRATEAKSAVADIDKIINQRLNTQKAMADVSETMLINTLGESGTGFGKFVSKPSIQAAIKTAREGAAETGTYFPKSPSDKFSVANLQRIKRAIAEDITGRRAQGSLAATSEAEIGGTLKTFTDFLRKKSKGFAKAEDMFAQEVTNVNRMKVLQAMSKKLKPNLGTQEKALQFANAADDANRLVRSETGRNMPLEEVLNSKQFRTVKRITSELDRDVSVKQGATKGMQRMNEVVGTMHDIPKVALLERTIVVFNAIMKRIEGRNTKVTLDMMADKFKNPAEIARIIKSASPEEAAIIKNIEPSVMAMIIGSEESK